MIVKDILASTYVLLDNATEEELEPSVALEHLASTLSMMKFEQIFGNLDDVIIKATVEFNDATGIVENTLTDFGDVVFLRFNNEQIDEASVNMLDEHYGANMQRVAFWSDASDNNTPYIQLSIPQQGSLEVWYEPYTTVNRYREADVDFHESLRWCIATRLASACLPYTKYRSIYKIQNKPVIHELLAIKADEWKQVYLEKVNRLGTNKPFTRIPYMAGR